MQTLCYVDRSSPQSSGKETTDFANLRQGYGLAGGSSQIFFVVVIPAEAGIQKVIFNH